MKICSLYGAGFYYIPGTDTCIKVGGFVRSEWLFDAGGSLVPFISGTNARFTRQTDSLINRSRGIMSWDTRSQTEFGTLRSYIRMGMQWTTNDTITGGSGAATYMDRAMIQLGGFTAGKTQSFYDFFNTPSYSNQTSFLWRDTGGTAVPVLAYTAQFGNGMSATLSIEDGNESANPIVSDANIPITAAGLFAVAGGTMVASNAGNRVPDIVGNFRIDQAWGSAQIAAAAHYLEANYYAGANQISHPDSEFGWAVGGGVKLNLPMLAKGDHLTVAANYCEGATRYCSSLSGTRGSGAGFGMVDSGDIGLGWANDAYYNSVAAANGQLQLSTSWNIQAGLNHVWNPKWQTSVAGGYFNYEADSSVVDGRCVQIPRVGGGNAGPGCLDWSAWTVSTRTTFTPVANLDLSVEVVYTSVESALTGVALSTVPTQGLPATLIGNDTEHWHGLVRAQRNFWP